MQFQRSFPAPILHVLGMIFCCLALSACGYSDELSHRHALLKLLWTEQYAELDKAITQAYVDKRKGKLSSNKLRTRFWQLQYADPAFAGRFDTWVARQASAHAHLARGWYRLQQASKIRGDGPSVDISADRKSAMRSLALSGLEDMEQALVKDPLCAMCVGGQIYANLFLGVRDPSLVEKALSLDPDLWQPVASHFISLSPQWGGDDEQMEAFIRSMQARGRSQEFLNRLNAMLFFQHGLIQQYGTKDAARAIEDYERAITHYPDSDALKNVAELYSAQGRHGKAAAALERNLRENDEWDLYSIEALAQAYFAQGKTRDGEKMMRKRDELIRRFRHGE